MSLLNQLTSIKTKSKKRVGRGYGSGKGGHTAGRGSKGQKARSKVAIWFEGGQLPMVKRLPMQKGKGLFKVVRPTAEITLDDLSKMKASKITLETLKLEKVIDKKFKKAKIINHGQLTRKVSISGIRVSAGAKKAIEEKGGELI